MQGEAAPSSGQEVAEWWPGRRRREAGSGALVACAGGSRVGEYCSGQRSAAVGRQGSGCSMKERESGDT
jgi:hypothetical protein